MVEPRKIYAQISEMEWRELRAEAARQGVSAQSYIGWVLRQHLAELGRPIEGSVKA